MKSTVVVIGGGLAGCSSAIRLAQYGHHVMLFEAGQYPRHKVCGEFMSHGCWEQFEALGMTESLRATHINLMNKSIISTPNGKMWEASLPSEAFGISRYKLDAMLAERARSLGVDVYTGTKVTDVDGTLNDGFQVTLQNRETINTKVVIGAYGKRSTLDKKLNRPYLEVRQPFIGLKMHFRNLPISDYVELHTFDGGYCGMSQVEDDITNVCLLVREAIFREYGQGHIETFINWMAQQNPLINERLQTGDPIWDKWLSISQVPFVRKSPMYQDIFMLGDAAGMITPLTGDGMEIALQSGEIAAQHIAMFLEGKQTANEVRHNFCISWRDTFQNRIRIGRLSQFFMFRPKWLKWGLRTFNTIPLLGDFFIQQTRQTTISM